MKIAIKVHVIVGGTLVRLRRYNLTLLEVVIALFLTSILSAALLSLFLQMERIAQLSSKNNEKSLKLNHLESRLRNVFLHTLSPKQIMAGSSGKEARFCTEEEGVSSSLIEGSSLLFVFDNGPDVDPRFSNAILARLFLAKEKKALMLASWPLLHCEEEPPLMRLELLHEGINQLSFRFFGRKEGDYGWFAVWEADQKKIPPIVEVELLLMDGSQWIFAFPLPNATEEVSLLAA